MICETSYLWRYRVKVDDYFEYIPFIVTGEEESRKRYLQKIKFLRAKFYPMMYEWDVYIIPEDIMEEVLNKILPYLDTRRRIL